MRESTVTIIGSGIAAQRLARMGVDEALAAAGARPGDEVRIGDLVLEYEEDAEA